MKVKFIGFGGTMEVPCYEDKNGKIYFDENNGKGSINLYTGAYLDDCGEICGEPYVQVAFPIECDEPFVRNPRERDYMMLSRYKMDCDYFLGCGNGHEGHLYFKDVNTHCNEMEKLWNSFASDQKPEWLTLDQIKEYRVKMLEKLNGGNYEY